MTIMSTAPMAKFGAMNAGVSFASASLRISSFCASVRPVVPTTGETFAASAVLTFSNTTSGRVKSTMTSGCKRARAAARSVSTVTPACGKPTSSPASAPPVRSTAPTSFKSASSCTALSTACPMRPQAPFTVVKNMRLQQKFVPIVTHVREMCQDVHFVGMSCAREVFPCSQSGGDFRSYNGSRGLMGALWNCSFFTYL